MLASGLQLGCGCQALYTSQLSRRLLHQTVLRLNVAAEQKETLSDENACWVRQRSATSRLAKEHRSKPFVKGPHDVLVKVEAASVNPMDVAMTGWYGDNILSLYQQLMNIQQTGPSSLYSGCMKTRPEERVSVLGRDFSGTVEDVGHMVHRFKPGDEIYGATTPIVEGSHAQYTLVTQQDICKKPANLSHVEAASIPYAALTFLSGWNCTSAWSPAHKNKRVHINSGAGGIGTFAIQYLKAIGCEVTVSASTSAQEVVGKLHPDHMLDYQSPTYEEELRKLAGFDVALDYAGDESALSCVKPQGWFVTAVNPLLKSTDDKGLVVGGAYAATLYGQKALQALLNHGVYYSWSFFTPNRTALEDIRVLSEDKKIVPVVEQVFPFDETPAAYEKVGKGKGRGKVVIDMTQ